MMIFPSPGDINSHLASLPAPLHPPTPLPAITQWFIVSLSMLRLLGQLGSYTQFLFQTAITVTKLDSKISQQTLRVNLVYNVRMKTFAELIQRVNEYKSVVIVPHIHPDGDALGAAFGLQGMLQPFTKAHIKVVGEHTSWSAWMGSFERVADEEWANALTIVVDTAKKELLFTAKALTAKEVILIDHHPLEEPYYTTSIIEPQATSTCEILSILADKASLSLTPKTANLLLYGLLSDTTVLQHPYTSKATMQAVAYLMDEGATYKPLVNQLIKRPYSVTQSLHQQSKSIQLTSNGLAYWLMDLKTIQQEGFTFNDLFSMLRSIEEARIIILVVELDDQYVLHAQSDHFNLQKILAPFGGGGHKFASKVRASSLTPLLDVIESLDDLLAKQSVNE